MKKNCNANIGDLSVKEKWGCKTTYTIVAGQYEVIDKDCIAVPFTVNDPSVNCQSLDESDYEVSAIICGSQIPRSAFSSSSCCILSFLKIVVLHQNQHILKSVFSDW